MADVLSLIDPELARLAGRGASQYQRKQPKQAPLTEDDQRSIVGQLRDSSIGTLAAVGNVLDLPGSSIRDVFAGENPIDQWAPWNWTSSEHRTSGRDLARQWGMAGKKDTWGNAIGGFGLEVATDPLTYLTLGASALGKSGKAAKAAGLMDELPSVVAKKTGTQFGQKGAREARLTTTLGDFAAHGSPAAQKTASELIQKGASADEVLGGLMGIGLPFRDPVMAVGTGARSVAAAQGLDKAGKAIRYGVPGVDAVARLFDARLGDTKTPWGQGLGKAIHRRRTKSEFDPKFAAAGDALDLDELGLGSDDIEQVIRGLAEKKGGYTPADVQGVMQKHSLSPEQAAKVTGVVDRVRQEAATMMADAKEWGLNTPELIDRETDYVARYLSDVMGNKGKSDRRLASGFNPSSEGRMDIFRDISGGTNTARKLTKDQTLNQMIDGTLNVAGRRATPADVAAYIGRTYGNEVSDAWRKYNPDTKKFRNKKSGRHQAIADYLFKLPKEIREAGIYGNHVLRDVEARTLHHQRQMVNAKSALEGLSQKGILIDPTTVDPTTRGLRSIKEVLAGQTGLGYKWGNDQGGIGKKLAESLGISPTKDNLKDLASWKISAEHADDLTKLAKKVDGPEAIGELSNFIDTATNFTKAMWTSAWPAFHVRNRISGLVHNWMLDMTDASSESAALGLMRGKEVKGAADIPAVQKLWNKPGKLTDKEATKILGQMMYAHGVLGKFDARATDVVAGASNNMIGGQLDDLLKGIERPGAPGFKAGRAARKFIGMEEGTNLKPWDVRGVGGRTDSSFGPLAAGEEIGHFVEGQNRAAPFIHLLKKGVDPAEAAKRVGAAQILYGNKNYTPFEQQVMSRLFPFFKFCVDPNHEILTKEGWKTYDQVVVGEEVMGYDHETGKMFWEPVEAVNVFEHVGEINWYKNRSTSFCWTDGHRWPVITEQKKKVMSNGEEVVKGGKKRWRTGKDFGYKDRLIDAGDFQEQKSALSPRLAAILGWLITDGYVRKRGNSMEAIVYQSPKKHLDSIVELLGTKPRNPHPDSGVVAVPVARTDINALRDAGFGDKQDAVHIAGKLSREAAEAMWQAMFDAEGTFVGINTRQMLFVQSKKNQPVIDTFQMLCVMTGRPFSTTDQQEGISQVCVRQVYRRVEKSRLSRGRYVGVVWCPTTPSGCWVMRHKGSAVVTGNSRGLVPQVMQQLAQRPGGKLAQAVRAQRLSQDKDELAPDYVRESASIPLGDLLGPVPEGTDRYLAGLGLMHEDAFSFGPNLKGAGLELLSRTNPFIKAPLETLTGQSFFQKGPEGGRPLDDLDPLIGRLIANVTRSDDPVRLPQWLEQTVANSPAARGLSTARQLTDRRKSWGGDSRIPGPASLLNVLTGLRITDVSPGSKDAIIRELLTKEQKDAGAAAFEVINFKTEDLAKMSPKDREHALRLQAFRNILVQRAKDRAAAKEGGR